MEIINHCKVCRLGLFVEDEVYIVPMNFGYGFDGEKLTLFFHSAHIGRKVSALRENASVSFEMDCAHRLISGDKPCEFSLAYESVMGRGRVHLLDSEHDKLDGLQQVMLHQSGQLWQASDYNTTTVLVFKLIVENISAKKNHQESFTL